MPGTRRFRCRGATPARLLVAACPVLGFHRPVPVAKATCESNSFDWLLQASSHAVFVRACSRHPAKACRRNDQASTGVLWLASGLLDHPSGSRSGVRSLSGTGQPHGQVLQAWWWCLAPVRPMCGGLHAGQVDHQAWVGLLPAPTMPLATCAGHRVTSEVLAAVMGRGP